MTSIQDDVVTTNVCSDDVVVFNSQHPVLEDEKITTSCSQSPPPSSLSFLGSDESFIVPLKVDRHTADKKDKNLFVEDDNDEHDCTTSSSTPSSPCNSDDDDDDVRGRGCCCHRRMTMVGFSDDVSVRIIPRRCDYPKEVRRIIFPNRKELSSNAARNMIEFEYEGFDWRNVKEGTVTTLLLTMDCFH